MIGFHIADASSTFTLSMSLADNLRLHPEFFRDDVKIASFFGCYPLIWNGGRMLLGRFNRRKAKEQIKAYNDRGIPYRFTFTNPHITEEHLGNIDCNEMLDFADNGLNEVIVNSPVLEEYIRRTHPGMKITSSTCKCLKDMGDVKSELKKDYSLVVLDYGFNNEFDKLEELTPDERKRCEILCNPICTPACPRRKAHYDYIGKVQLEYTGMMRSCDNVKKKMDELGINEWECEFRSAHFYETPHTSSFVEPCTVYEKYVPMGFENFKIEGRGASMGYLCENIIAYMAKPEYLSHVRYNILTPALHFNDLNF